MKDHIIVKKLKKFSILGTYRVREKIARDEAKRKSIRGYNKRDSDSGRLLVF